MGLLAAIRAELFCVVGPDLITMRQAYLQIGQMARHALELVVGWLAIGFASAMAAIAAVRWALQSG